MTYRDVLKYVTAAICGILLLITCAAGVTAAQQETSIAVSSSDSAGQNTQDIDTHNVSQIQKSSDSDESLTQSDSGETHTNPDLVYTYWQGQSILFEGEFTAGETYEIRAVDSAGETSSAGEVVSEVTATADGELLVQTNTISEGSFVVEDDTTRLSTGDPLPEELADYDGFAFEIAVQLIEVNEVEDSIIENRPLTIGEIPSTRAGYDLTVTAVADSGAETTITTLTDLGDFEENVEIDPGLEPGDYTLNFNVTDTTASDSADLTVSPSIEGPVTFDADFFTEDRGDIATISLSTEGLGSSERFWVRIGDEAGVNYETVLEVSPTIPEPVDDPEQGEVIIELNTFVAGSDERLGVAVDESDAFTASSGTIHDVERLTDPVPRVLDSINYELEALGEDPRETAEGEFAESLDVAVMDIQSADVNNVTAWTSPRGTPVATALEDELLARSNQISLSEDRRVLSDTAIYEINVEGVYGALAFLRDAGETDTTAFEQAVAAPQGPVLAFDYRQLNPADDRGPKRMGNFLGHSDAGDGGDGIDALQETIDRGALSATFAPDSDTIYVAMTDIGNAEVYTRKNPTEEINTGDEFQISANWGLGLVNEFNEADIGALDPERQKSDTQDVLDRTARFDGVRLDDGTLQIRAPSSADAVISGTTSVADNTVMNIRVTSPDADQPLFQTADVVVEDGEFEATFDFSDFDEGTNITAVIPGQGLDDNAETAGQLIDPEAPFLEVSNLNPQDVTVEQGAVIDVSATVTNTGGQEASQTVEFRVGDDTLAEQDVTLEQGTSTTTTFDGIDTSGLEGTFTHGVSSADDTQEGSLTVEGGGSSISDYTDKDGDTTTDLLRQAIGDWRNNEIDTDLLRDVIASWRSG